MPCEFAQDLTWIPEKFRKKDSPLRFWNPQRLARAARIGGLELYHQSTRKPSVLLTASGSRQGSFSGLPQMSSLVSPVGNQEFTCMQPGYD